LCLLIPGTILGEPYRLLCPYSTQGYAKTVHCVHCFHGVSLKLHQIAPQKPNGKGDSNTKKSLVQQSKFYNII